MGSVEMFPDALGWQRIGYEIKKSRESAAGYAAPIHNTPPASPVAAPRVKVVHNADP